GIWRLQPMFHLMLEAVVEWEELVEDAGSRRDAIATLSPGFRTGWNTGDAQTIFGVAMPIEMNDGGADFSVLGYFSYELPFVRRP
ncbi:MAG: hypothetical protein ACREUC_17170, partial [Steroidobacteraceae bacterium]